MDYCDYIQHHYESKWSSTPIRCTWRKGPIHELPSHFRILRFAPTPKRTMWTYATCCMSMPTDTSPVELHLFSNVESDSLVELLAVVAHYHRTNSHLSLGHTVNFGRPWLPRSRCDHGLLSLPYLDGPDLEFLTLTKMPETTVRFLWLVPVFASEVQYAKSFGVDSLEQKFEEREFNYLDPLRPPVV